MNPVVSADFTRFVSSLFGELAKDRVSWERFEQLNETNGALSYQHPGFDLLNVRYLIFRPTTATIPSGAGFSEVFRDAQAVIVSNKDARPRVWFAQDIRVLGSDDEILKHIAQEPESTLSTAFLAQTPEWKSLQLPPSESKARIQVTEHNSSGYVLRVVAKEKQLVVIGDLHHQGYRAWAHNIELPVVRVDGGLLGVLVPRGEYELTLSFSPPYATTSMILLGLGVALLAAGGLRVLRPYPVNSNTS